ncbi:MAG TPA: hypothetical protein VLB44_03350 [Kofleriaceae bacterium]|nr:hypothetical protein [Kofleriaceae bacterium]
MSWANVATLISRYRHAATLAISGALALVMTLGTQRGPFQLGLSSAVKYFTFVFFVAVVLVAIAFTILLVIAETKVEAAKRAAEPEFPVAIAKQVTPPSPPRAPLVEPPKEPERDISAGPSVLR